MIDNLPERRTIGGDTTERWTLFARQLHVHHTAADESLWPMLRSAIAGPGELAVLPPPVRVLYRRVWLRGYRARFA